MTKITLASVVPDLSLIDFSTGIKLGYSLANEIVSTNSLFDSIPGKEVYPFIRNAAVNFSVSQYIAKQMPGLLCDQVLNVKRNCHHLEIKYGNIVITLNAVNFIDEFPRDAVYRYGLQQGNQISMEECWGTGNITQLTPSSNQIYLVALYGRREVRREIPDFIRIGLPLSDRREFIDVVDLSQPMTLVTSVSDEEQLSTLKSQFLEILPGVMNDL